MHASMPARTLLDVGVNPFEDKRTLFDWTKAHAGMSCRPAGIRPSYSRYVCVPIPDTFGA